VDPAILYALLSALAYGASDFLSQIAGKYVGAWRATLYYYAIGVVALSVCIGLQPGYLQQVVAIPRSGWLISAGSGVLLLTAVLLFTQGLIKGSIAVVVPVMASYGAVTTLLASLSGEQFTQRTALGIALTIAGAAGSAVPPAGIRFVAQTSGLPWACGAALAYGTGFWLQGSAVPIMGPLLPIWTVYVTGLVVMVVLHMARLIDLSPPRSYSLMIPALAAAVLGVVAFMALNAGLSSGRVAVVVVLSSLSTAVTVVLARLLNHARMAWHQWLAIALVLIGLSLVKS
jgi:uncharacterized membrane protein